MYESVLELFKKTDLRFDRRFQEVADQIAATDRAIEKTHKEVGTLTRNVGAMVEKMVGDGSLVAQFRALGLRVKSHSRHKFFGDEGTANSGEIDLFLEDGDVAILVEAKTTLKQDDVEEHIERIEKYRRFADADGPSGKRFVGAVAGTVIAENVINFAHSKGLYVIIQSARAVEILPQPDGLRAQEW
jgi:hypothetical protein